MRLRTGQLKYIILFFSFALLILSSCENNPQQSAAKVLESVNRTVSPTVVDVPSVTPTLKPSPTSVPTVKPEPSVTPTPSPTLSPTAIPTIVATATPVPTVAPPSKAIITTTIAPTEVSIKEPVVISSLDKKSEYVSVKNLSDKDIDLSGWYIISVTGNQRFDFPDGYIIKAGAEIKVVSYEASGDLIWTKKNMWNNSKDDPAELYNGEGELLSRWDD